MPVPSPRRPTGGTSVRAGALPWCEAAEHALYGPAGFFTAGAGPVAHFRTSVHVGGPFAAAVARLLDRVDASLGRPDGLDLVDVGAGGGELVLGVRAALAAQAAGGPGPLASSAAAGDLLARTRVTCVELAPRRVDDDTVRWASTVPDGVVGLVVAHEWLDDVPLDVVQVDRDGVVRTVLVTPDGAERLGPPVSPEDAAWLARWWPLDDARPGDRAEVGRTRDEAWAAVVSRLRRGVAVAVDYAHARADRAAGRLAAGTLTGHRDGRAVAPVPDGTCDLTAHVALDACAAAGLAAGADASALLRQRDALRDLGVDDGPGGRPPRGLADTDPVGYLRTLADHAAAAELLDPHGLGGFGWLVQAKGVALPVPR